MPTARELLEQADALMRRNRAGAPARGTVAPPTESRIPVPSLPGVVTSPRPIQREPIAPSIVHTALPLDAAEGEPFTEPAPLPSPVAATPPVAFAPAPAVVPEPEFGDDADFPVLTEAVDDQPAAMRAGAHDDDVPLLTDAVDTVDIVGIDEPARGEPSLWALTSRGEASLLRASPESLLRTPDRPPAADVPQAPPEGRDPLGLDQPLPGFGGFGARATPPAPATPAAPPAIVHAIEPAEADDEPQVFSASMSHMPPEDAEEAAVGAGDPPAGEGYEAVVEPVASEFPSYAESASTPRAGEAQADVQGDVYGGEAFASNRDEAVAPGVIAASDGPPTTALVVAPDDDRRIREIAEEIGMQVLQRIDIFTDTTLRAQLAERLRPVIDRAAADMVSGIAAAINQHVGELLRAQVSEAIEREIESWKSNR